ncbi:MAG TPA: trypsin-like serine protease [Kineosporiaceae bacterium]
MLGLLVGGPATRSSAIINGNTPDAAPSWAVNLLSWDGQELAPQCSGVLIAPNLILTVAHCEVVGKNPGFAYIGRANPNPTSTGAAEWVVAAYPHSSEDLAVAQLREPVQLIPIKISSDDAAGNTRHIPYTVYGYGKTKDLTQPGGIDGILRRAVGLIAACPPDAKVLPPDFCLTSPSIQAPCSGDSGGPLVNPDGELVGISKGVLHPSGKATCLGSYWRTVATGGSMRAWIQQMIDAHGQSTAR